MTDAFNYWDELRRSKESALAGVCQLSGYIFSRTTPSIVRVRWQYYYYQLISLFLITLLNV